MTDAESWIVDVDATRFEKTVIETSFQVPVLLDFWATWCEPCKVLGPLLEKRARDGAGRFLLAKVDIDANPELVQALRVQGVPAVLAISQGKVVDGFEGALGEAEIDAFLDRVAPAGPDAAAGSAGLIEQARSLALGGAVDEAVAGLREHLRSAPDDTEVRLALADLLVDHDRTPEAELLVEKLTPEVLESTAGKALVARIAFAKGADSLEELRQRAVEHPDDFEARLAYGKACLIGKRYEDGLEELLEAVRLAPEKRADEAKAPMLETFELLGLEDPIANDYRFKLSLELFA